ncbi:MAG: hypothetical protein WDA60_02610, partial [Acidimicrobiia bacterium]
MGVVVVVGPVVVDVDVVVGTVPVTRNRRAALAVPFGVVTETRPVVASAGTVAVTCVGLSTVNVASAPLNVTAVAPSKFVPVITTCVPTVPRSGATRVIDGAVDGAVVVVVGGPVVVVGLVVGTVVGLVGGLVGGTVGGLVGATVGGMTMTVAGGEVCGGAVGAVAGA